MTKHECTCTWSARVTDWGIHIECRDYWQSSVKPFGA
jgi:hypothetical protein